MTVPSGNDIMAKIITRLKADSTLVALCPAIYNHIPQDNTTPLIRVRWSNVNEWDTKDSDGLSGSIVCDIWTDYRGDSLGQSILERLDALLHLQPLSLANSQSLILRHASYDHFTEPDGVTHHAVVQYLHIATT